LTIGFLGKGDIEDCCDPCRCKDDASFVITVVDFS